MLRVLKCVACFQVNSLSQMLLEMILIMINSILEHRYITCDHFFLFQKEKNVKEYPLKQIFSAFKKKKWYNN